MSAHDPLCPLADKPTGLQSWGFMQSECHCDLIKRVRADERETLIRRVEAEIHHAADNGHVLDWRCQGVAPGEVVPAVRVDYIRAAIRGAL